MAVTAETQSEQWMLAANEFPELERQARLRTGEFMGKVALATEVTVEAIDDTTLLAGIQLSALGDRPSYELVKTNVATDAAERLFKAGHQTEVYLKYQSGKLWQNGRKQSDINQNTFKYMHLNSVMEKRAGTELGNTLLFESLIDQGALEKFDVVVFSPTPTDVGTRRDYNFFTDTDSLSIQYLKGSDGQYMLETAMVAGKVSPDAPRHDLEAIKRLLTQNGLEITVDDENELLNQVMLVPKTATSGVHDIVRQYDDIVGGTFYGERKPRQDYEAYREVCKQRSRDFDGLVADITNQLLAEAHAFETPIDAIRRLDELSEWFCVKRAVQDTSIDAEVFGSTAAFHIEQARYYEQNGDLEQAAFSLNVARKTADSSSCPIFKGEENSSSKSDGSPDSEENSGKKKWMNCPHCSAKVYDDPCAKLLACWDCKAMVINGRVVSTGNGGSKQRKTQQSTRDSELKAKAAAMAEQVDQAFKEQGVESFESKQQVAPQAGKAALASV